MARSFEAPISGKPGATSRNPAGVPYRVGTTPRLTSPLSGPLPRRSRTPASYGVTCRWRSPAPTERRSLSRPGGPARNRSIQLGADSAQLVIAVEDGRTYFGLAGFEAEPWSAIG